MKPIYAALIFMLTTATPPEGPAFPHPEVTMKRSLFGCSSQQQLRALLILNEGKGGYKDSNVTSLVVDYVRHVAGCSFLWRDSHVMLLKTERRFCKIETLPPATGADESLLLWTYARK
jgi:hypothetical protein